MALAFGKAAPHPSGCFLRRRRSSWWSKDNRCGLNIRRARHLERAQRFVPLKYQQNQLSKEMEALHAKSDIDCICLLVFVFVSFHLGFFKIL